MRRKLNFLWKLKSTVVIKELFVNITFIRLLNYDIRTFAKIFQRFQFFFAQVFFNYTMLQSTMGR